MPRRSPVAALSDIVEACALIRAELNDVALDAFEANLRQRWIVERGLEIISEASRRLDPDLKRRHPHIPWQKVAGIGNVLRHDYAAVAADVIWRLVQAGIPEIEAACRIELAASTDGFSP
jgi:uncharacterized protein with HEPN domain